MEQNNKNAYAVIESAGILVECGRTDLAERLLKEFLTNKSLSEVENNTAESAQSASTREPSAVCGIPLLRFKYFLFRMLAAAAIGVFILLMVTGLAGVFLKIQLSGAERKLSDLAIRSLKSSFVMDTFRTAVSDNPEFFYRSAQRNAASGEAEDIRNAITDMESALASIKPDYEFYRSYLLSLANRLPAEECRQYLDRYGKGK